MLVELNLRPAEKALRQFGFIAFVALGLFAAFGPIRFPAAYAFVAASVLSLLFSLLWPKGNRPLYVLLTVAAYPIGWVVSHLVMALLFFAILTPVALLFRILGRDPLERKWDRGRSSYWVDLPGKADPRDYFRQF